MACGAHFHGFPDMMQHCLGTAAPFHQQHTPPSSTPVAKKQDINSCHVIFRLGSFQSIDKGALRTVALHRIYLWWLVGSALRGAARGAQARPRRGHARVRQPRASQPALNRTTHRDLLSLFKKTPRGARVTSSHGSALPPCPAQVRTLLLENGHRVVVEAEPDSGLEAEQARAHVAPAQRRPQHPST